MDYALNMIDEVLKNNPELKHVLVDLLVLGYREGMVDAYGGETAKPSEIEYALSATENFYSEMALSIESRVSEHTDKYALHNRIRNMFDEGVDFM
jgi:hypothetical protein